jgi:hypothetical protein
MPNDFEAFAKTALGTSDPERIAAFKEAVMACMEKEEAGGYDEEADEGDDMAKGKGKSMSLLFGG